MVFAEIVLREKKSKNDNQQNKTRHLFHADCSASVRVNPGEQPPKRKGDLALCAPYAVEFSSIVATELILSNTLACSSPS